MANEPLTCGFGMPDVGRFDGPAHCLFCLAESQRLQAEFEAAVARGEYDAQGYTPAERRAQAKRAARG